MNSGKKPQSPEKAKLDQKSTINDDFNIVEVATLYPKEYFCDYELVHQTPMFNTFVTTIPSDLIQISLYDIIELFSDHDIQLIHANTRKYYTDKKLIDQL